MLLIWDSGSKYMIAPAPDEILIELFQVDKTKLPPQYVDYFE